MLKIETQENKQKLSQNFKGANISPTLQGGLKIADLFIKSQENLSSTRFIQDTATNWLPKAIFARSKEDLAEMSFLEFIESGIFYFASPILGEKFFRNVIFKNFQPKESKDVINSLIPKSTDEIWKNTSIDKSIKNSALTSKAGIVLACTMIPVAEYTLSFAKNYFTLKTFNKSNFNNIANLDKNNNEKEDKAQQERVEKSSKKQFKKAAIISSLGVMAGCSLALASKKTDKLQNVSKAILEPGKAAANLLDKAGFKNQKVKDTISKFSLDFASENGKLALSKGQLALTAIVGLFGYSNAAKDRGRLDVCEVWTRVPLVVFYTIFGSELFEKGFINFLNKKKKFPDLIKKDKNGILSTPSRKELPQIAQNLAKERGVDANAEFKKLLKQKTITTAIPYIFSLVFMGFTLSAITRLWTQYRYNHSKTAQNNKDKNFLFLNKPLPKEFQAFDRTA